MPYNEYRAMGNDTIGAITDAEQMAMRQQELERALGRRPQAPAKPKLDPMEFLMANALQQRAQATQAPASPREGFFVGPGRGKSDVELANERAALSEARTAEEIARAKMMQTRQDIRENRPGIPGQSDGVASYVKGQSFPDFLPPQTAATFQDGRVVMPSPTPVEKEVLVMGGQGPSQSGDPRAVLVNMIQSAMTGNNPFAPKQSASKSRYDQLIGGATQEPDDPIKRLRERVADKLADEGDPAAAANVLEGGDLPTKAKPPLVSSEQVLAALDQGLNEFTTADTSMGWDPGEDDIANLVQLAEAADRAMAAEREVPPEEARRAIDLILMQRLAPAARGWSGEWTKKLQTALRNRGRAPVIQPPTQNPAVPSMPAYNIASVFGG